MNNGAGGTRRWVRRTAVTAVLAGRAVVAAACGGGGGGSPATARLTAYQKALAYSQCMRTHGISSFPGPVVISCGITFDPPAGCKPNSPQFQSAQQACRKLLPGGGP